MKPYIKLFFTLLIPLVIVVVYASIQFEIPGICKADISKYRFHSPEIDSLPADIDTSMIIVEPEPASVDTAKQRILFFGDSMLEGLSKRFSDYAKKNGHELKSVIWYSSSTVIWANSDTLDHFIKQVDPTLIITCLGSNELFVRDLPARDKAIKGILEKIGDTPFVWIGPPNWRKDTGIDSLILENVGEKRFFDSSHLTLERGGDHAHPTFAAASRWMDTIAVWMSDCTLTAHAIVMDFPEFTGSENDCTLLAPLKK